MLRYQAEQIRSFLVAIDQHLTAPARIVIIGGSAVSLTYASEIRTKDIDTFQSMTAALTAAAQLAEQETGLAIPIGDVTVADLPYDFEDRLVAVATHLTRLQIWAPEIHDLAISKSLRGNENDVLQLRAVRDMTPLDPDVLIARFRDEMSHAIGDHRRIKADFIYVIDDLFGALARSEAEKQLEGWEKR